MKILTLLREMINKVKLVNKLIEKWNNIKYKKCNIYTIYL